jgi:N utilization substance protein B
VNRHLSRIVAMQSLYEVDFRDLDCVESVVERNLEEFSGKVDEDFVKSLVEGSIKNLKIIDDTINKSAPDWPINQSALVDKAILRIAVYELFKNTDVPPKVVINEAVELSKQFGSENSSRFVNGVLGTIYDNQGKTRKKTK